MRIRIFFFMCTSRVRRDSHPLYTYLMNLLLILYHLTCGIRLLSITLSVKFYLFCGFFWPAIPSGFVFINRRSLSLDSFVLVQKILQRTPIRVLHRRSPLEREKIIHWLETFQLVA